MIFAYVIYISWESKQELISTPSRLGWTIKASCVHNCLCPLPLFLLWFSFFLLLSIQNSWSLSFWVSRYYAFRMDICISNLCPSSVFLRISHWNVFCSVIALASSWCPNILSKLSSLILLEWAFKYFAMNLWCVTDHSNTGELMILSCTLSWGSRQCRGKLSFSSRIFF